MPNRRNDERHGRSPGCYRVLAAVGTEHDLAPLLHTAGAIAGARDGEVRVLTVTRNGLAPSWLSIPDTGENQAAKIETVTRAGDNPSARSARSGTTTRSLILGLHSAAAVRPVSSRANARSRYPGRNVRRHRPARQDQARIRSRARPGCRRPQRARGPAHRAFAPRRTSVFAWPMPTGAGPEMLVGESRLATMVHGEVEHRRPAGRRYQGGRSSDALSRASSQRRTKAQAW